MEKEDVDKLNAFQKRPFHPMTCGNDRTDEKHLDGEGKLVATEGGWICPFCDYKQAFGKIENHILIIDWDGGLTEAEIEYGETCKNRSTRKYDGFSPFLFRRRD